MVKAIQDEDGKNNGYFCFHSRLHNYRLQITLRLVGIFFEDREWKVMFWIERISIENSYKLLSINFYYNIKYNNIIYYNKLL